MCLATPARVIRVEAEEALVDLDGVRLRVSTVMTPDLQAGDIALVHVGFALSRIDEAQAAETLAALNRATQGAAP